MLWCRSKFGNVWKSRDFGDALRCPNMPWICPIGRPHSHQHIFDFSATTSVGGGPQIDAAMPRIAQSCRATSWIPLDSSLPLRSLSQVQTGRLLPVDSWVSARFLSCPMTQWSIKCGKEAVTSVTSKDSPPIDLLLQVVRNHNWCPAFCWFWSELHSDRFWSFGIRYAIHAASRGGWHLSGSNHPLLPFQRTSNHQEIWQSTNILVYFNDTTLILSEKIWYQQNINNNPTFSRVFNPTFSQLMPEVPREILSSRKVEPPWMLGPWLNSIKTQRIYQYYWSYYWFLLICFQRFLYIYI